jgi:enoyl-CoA hydratase/carnithine racemase
MPGSFAPMVAPACPTAPDFTILADMSGAPDLLLASDGPVARLVFNRPHARNAVTQAMWRALPGLLDEVARDAAVRVLVVQGVDATAFASGADIAEFESVYGTPAAARASSEAIDRAIEALATLPKPVVAMIRGVCVGGGCSLALACDLRFAEAGARFAVTPAKLGLCYSLADTRRLVAAVGLSRAKDLLYTGRIVGAEEALAMGLVDRVIPAGEIEAATLAWTKQLQSTAGSAHAATRRILGRLAAGAPDDDAEAKAIFLDCFAGDDFAEGFRAFLEKRKPRF